MKTYIDGRGWQYAVRPALGNDIFKAFEDALAAEVERAKKGGNRYERAEPESR